MPRNQTVILLIAEGDLFGEQREEQAPPSSRGGGCRGETAARVVQHLARPALHQ